MAPAATPLLHAVPGVTLAAAETNYRYRGRPDLLLMRFAAGSVAAGVFTRSLTAGAPVLWSREALRRSGGRISALVVNAGNANAFTGRLGEAAVGRMGQALAGAANCPEEEILQASTGVIGEPLDAERLVPFLPQLMEIENGEAKAWHQAAEAIRTTDTFPKSASRQCMIDGKTVTLTGIAKGSGMIAPDMATMLAFVATDAGLPAVLLQGLLMRSADKSFNAITVDSDTSTSDSLVVVATGQAGHDPIANDADPRLQGFVSALDDLLLELALLVVKDGEGAQKLISITLKGAETDRAAKVIALAIANSPLVKTAIAGADANWGRIVMAVGKAGERAERDRLSVAIGGIAVAQDGQRVEGYDEAPVARHMQGQEIDIEVDVGVGQGQAQVWTCDLTHGYIDINADYRS
ncbi:MAG: bifunctional glutamate N-acetyltransferase/amino-acid acetyltransferase ArgJ [Kiloniellales bacterium]